MVTSYSASHINMVVLFGLLVVCTSVLAAPFPGPFPAPAARPGPLPQWPEECFKGCSACGPPYGCECLYGCGGCGFGNCNCRPGCGCGCK
ncbi:chorion class high-cysteine HCA protein 12-like isoform X1 [Homalodisca vitripennis]|uniref:chorion class high-cysteine HCA protein 12-like isoform X1 n=1 Tax=Homalodisca vitripennis TaxID=197043 RepID=UPI001EEB862B|nr:chorion class high-cysteine HCA protein 12-like isoform X1 [Homalodisca vitripennis]KAG8325342.1 hypothetical protein J6590_070148 [Homalodisca vitripennis]